MPTVLSHIVQKQFSREYENVATEALAFILHSNESARNGMMKLLRAVASDIPDLQFRTTFNQRFHDISASQWRNCGFDYDQIPLSKMGNDRLDCSD